MRGSGCSSGKYPVKRHDVRKSVQYDEYVGVEAVSASGIQQQCYMQQYVWQQYYRKLL